MKTKILIAVVAALIIGYVIYSNNSSGGALKIGVVIPITGIVADYGEDIIAGIESASTGDVEFVYEDTECDPKKAVSAYKKLVEFDKVQFIFGPACGSPQEAIVPLVRGQDVVVLVPSAATEKLYDESGKKIFNVQYSLERESKFIGESMFERGHEKVVLIAYRNAFSEAHANGFRDNYEGEIVREVWFNESTDDVSTEIAKLKGLDFDAIYSTDISFMFGQGNQKLSQFGIDKPLFSNYVVELPAARDLVEGVIYSFPEGITDNKGASYGLAKEGAKIFSKFVEDCRGKISCVKQKFEDSDQFSNGVHARSMIMKEIRGGEAIILN